VRFGVALACLLLVAGGVACSRPATSAPVIRTLPDDPSLPYVITAIDYHFHDAHPTRDLDPTRAVTFSSQGSVMHNVTIPASGYSHDLAPGQRITLDALGKRLGGAGTYEMFCAYHVAQGMRGTIVIA
jgi:plastocyanin